MPEYAYIYRNMRDSCESKRFVQSWNKVERRYIQEQQPNKFQYCNQKMDLSIEWTRTWPSTGLLPKSKSSGGPHLPDVVLQNTWSMYRINKDEGDESPSFFKR